MNKVVEILEVTVYVSYSSVPLSAIFVSPIFNSQNERHHKFILFGGRK